MVAERGFDGKKYNDTLYSAEMSDEFPVRWTAHSIMDDLVELCGGGTLQVYGVC